jgi:hypothetical protein
MWHNSTILMANQCSTAYPLGNTGLETFTYTAPEMQLESTATYSVFQKNWQLKHAHVAWSKEEVKEGGGSKETWNIQWCQM